MISASRWHGFLEKHSKNPCQREALIICRSEEHTSELQSRENLVCRLLLEKKNHSLYVLDTLRVSMHLIRITCLLCAIAQLLACSVQIHLGVGIPSLMSFMRGFGSLCVLV